MLIPAMAKLAKRMAGSWSLPTKQEIMEQYDELYAERVG